MRVNNEWERKRKEAVVASYEAVSPAFGLQGLRKIAENLSHDSWVPAEDRAPKLQNTRKQIV
jgi:hypothetical protein